MVDVHKQTCQTCGSIGHIGELSSPLRDTPHIAQYPFEIVSQRGHRSRFSLVCIGYRASIAEITLLYRGSRTSSAHARGRGIAANLFTLRHPWGYR